jgi:hypothetical protein
MVLQPPMIALIRVLLKMNLRTSTSLGWSVQRYPVTAKAHSRA